jgi:hypothetical protein
VIFSFQIQSTKEDKDWLYPQMIQGIKTIRDSIILVFSPTKLLELVNYGKDKKMIMDKLVSTE